MILAWSQFKVANGMEDQVRDAFLNRPGWVDDKPGFLGMETFTDCGDPACFHLVTRWTDVASYEAWHASPGHRESHKFIPKGLKLEPSFTKLLKMDRIVKAGGESSTEEQVRDLAPLLAQFISHSTFVHWIVLQIDGQIISANQNFARELGRSLNDLPRTSLWNYMTDPDAEALRTLLAAGVRRGDVRHRLNFVNAEDHPFTLDCHVDVQPGRAVLLGEAPGQSDSRAQQEMLSLTNELSTLNREFVRQNRELNLTKARLEESLEGLRSSNWHLAKIQEFLPVCYRCHRVRVEEQSSKNHEAEWTTLLQYLSRNAVDFSHGLCPTCYAEEVKDLENPNAEDRI